jgi:hypothetical protein
MFLACSFISPWWWWQYVPLKCRVLTRAIWHHIQENSILHTICSFKMHHPHNRCHTFLEDAITSVGTLMGGKSRGFRLPFTLRKQHSNFQVILQSISLPNDTSKAFGNNNAKITILFMGKWYNSFRIMTGNGLCNWRVRCFGSCRVNYIYIYIYIYVIQPASLPMCTWVGALPGVKQLGWMPNVHLKLASWSRKHGSIHLIPLQCSTLFVKDRNNFTFYITYENITANTSSSYYSVTDCSFTSCQSSITVQILCSKT